jgi:hypothetical protein
MKWLDYSAMLDHGSSLGCHFVNINKLSNIENILAVVCVQLMVLVVSIVNYLVHSKL